MLDQRGRLLRAALGFAGLPRPSYDRALHGLHTWLDSRTGIGHIVVGMERQGYDVSVTRYLEGWRATFIRRDHSTRPWVGQVLSFHPTPWRAVQHAAWVMLSYDDTAAQ